MRHAVIISRTREGQRRELKTSSGNKNLRVDWIESLYLATRGGKKAVGMGGKFEVGLEFDAQMSAYLHLHSSLSGSSPAGR